MGTATEELATEHQATRCVNGWYALGLRLPCARCSNQLSNRVGLLDASSACTVAGNAAARAGSKIAARNTVGFQPTHTVFLNTPSQDALSGTTKNKVES